ncbi:MAG: electron transfer flavoprotein-ubiquinone oxidoreductase [Candidatus Sericytochromatia bacterium]|nr:electron transfer flavoprotein-ubiquinone oxidoreductase [Candidatus Sericytochromatia bacterium]
MERDVVEMGLVIVGGGPAGLSCALRLAQLIDAHNADVAAGKVQGTTLDKDGIVVLEKATDMGSHQLSGAVLDPRALRELLPDFEAKGCPVESPVTSDEVLVLGEDVSFRLPVVPPALDNHGNLIVSLNRFVGWLSGLVEQAGITVASGMPVGTVLYDGDRVIGVRGTDSGVDRAGAPKAGVYQPGTDFMAPLTVFAEGTRGHLAKDLIACLGLDKDRHPQRWSQGIKEIWKIRPEKHQLGKVTHTMGWPLRQEEYGGSFIYHIADHHVSIGFVTGLEYQDPRFDPHRAMQEFKTHPIVRDLLEGGTLVRYGAKTIPTGGWHTMPRLAFEGGLLLGDSAALVNSMRLKGIHTAMKSGMIAAEVAFEAMKRGEAPRTLLDTYEQRLRSSWVGKELHSVRDFHQGFERGLLGGLVNAGFVTVSGGLGLFTGGLGHEGGHTRMQTLAEYYPDGLPADDFRPDGVLTFRKLDEVIKSGTIHEENQPCHLVIAEEAREDICNDRCTREYGNPCQHFCPAQVYEMVSAVEGEHAKLVINASNCVHCKTCDIMDPYQVITWVAPEAGGGPVYSGM